MPTLSIRKWMQNYYCILPLYIPCRHVKLPANIVVCCHCICFHLQWVTSRDGRMSPLWGPSLNVAHWKWKNMQLQHTTMFSGSFTCLNGIYNGKKQESFWIYLWRLTVVKGLQASPALWMRARFRLSSPSSSSTISSRFLSTSTTEWLWITATTKGKFSCKNHPAEMWL